MKCIGMICTVAVGMMICGSALAAFGALADEQAYGIGKVHRLTARTACQNPLLCDDMGILFSAVGDSGEVMYRFDPQSGNAAPVCSRILCDHRSRRCSLYRLHRFLGDTNMGGMSWFAADGAILYAVLKEDTFTLRRWEPAGGRDSALYDFPAYIVQTDALGIACKTAVGVYCAAQLDYDTLFVHCGDTGYLFDGQMQLRFTFPVEPAYNRYTWTDRALFWCEGQRLHCCDLQSGDVRICAENVLTQSYAASADADSVYCISGQQLYRWDAETDSAVPLTDAEPGAGISLIDGKLYFAKEGQICRMNTQTGETEIMPTLDSVPVAKYGSKLLCSHSHNDAARLYMAVQP